MPEMEAGPSRHKGKGIDPRNWGAIDVQIKTEPKSTSVGFFDDGSTWKFGFGQGEIIAYCCCEHAPA
jgi:hypothetical protein